MRRVVIVEWLSPDDRPTGTQLHKRLLQRGGRLSAEIVRVDSAEALMRAVNGLALELDTKGTPILHLEAHGEVAGLGLIGPDGRGGEELLTWQHLAPSLTALNIATQLNLIVVSAACFGHGALYAMAPTHVVPFMSVVGPTTGVSEGSLFDAMLELYRQLGGDAPNLPDAVASAQRELREGETLAETTWRDIVEGAIAKVVLAKAEPGVIATLYDTALPRLTNMRPGGPLALDQFARIHRDATVQGVDALLDNMLGRTLFPGAFRDLDVDARKLVARILSDAE